MTHEDPESRPNAASAYQQWQDIRDRTSKWNRSSRLQSRAEGLTDKLIWDTVSLVRWVFGLK